MENTILIHHAETARIRCDITERPDNCDYPIRGLPWQIAEDEGYWMSVQQTGFFGGHLQLLELLATQETRIAFTALEPVVFMVVMIEGFFQFYQQEKLLSYAMGGTYYISYNPSTTAELRASEGKHAILLYALDSSSFDLAERVYPEMNLIVKSIRWRSALTVRLPVCRMSRQVIELWSDIRKASPNLHVRSSDITASLSRLILFYHLQLEKGDIVRGLLSMEIANALILYVDANYTSDCHISVKTVSAYIGEPERKIDEYAFLLYKKTLNRHVMDLRMVKTSQLLLDTELSIGAIAIRVGLSQGSYFLIFFVANCIFCGTAAEYIRNI